MCKGTTGQQDTITLSRRCRKLTTCRFHSNLQEGNALEEEVAALLEAAGAASAHAVQEAEEKLAMKVWKCGVLDHTWTA